MIAHDQPNTTKRGEVYHETSLDVPKDRPHFVAMAERTLLLELGRRIRLAREAKGWSQTDLGRRAHQSQSAISAWEKGEREPGRDVVARLARELSVDPRSLEVDDFVEGEEALVPIIGTVGADPTGLVIRTANQDDYGMVDPPTGGTSKSVALLVEGHSMGKIIEDGSLIYFENQETPPSADLLGQKVVVQLAGDGDESTDPDVLVKILRRGNKPNTFDLESINGPTLEDVKVRWAAEIIQIIPPRQAKRLIKRGLA